MTIFKNQIGSDLKLVHIIVMMITKIREKIHWWHFSSTKIHSSPTILNPLRFLN